MSSQVQVNIVCLKDIGQCGGFFQVVMMENQCIGVNIGNYCFVNIDGGISLCIIGIVYIQICWKLVLILNGKVSVVVFNSVVQIILMV